MKKLILVAALLTHQLSYAQKEAYVWCFGEGITIDFNSGKPVSTSPRNNHYGGAAIGNASICSPSGRLLFSYVEGGIFDSTYMGIPYNKGCGGGISTMNIIVPYPDSSHLYYLFRQTPGDSRFSGLFYSIINMKLNSGKGDIMPPYCTPIPMFPAATITGVKHANRKDYWIVLPRYNSDTIYSYQITSSGISNKPVKSITGLKGVSVVNDSYFYGYIKMSPDGKKLAIVSSRDSSFIADFDASTGKISNPWHFKIDSGFIGLEFSAKSRYLYTGDLINKGRIIQFDITQKTLSSFLASKKTVDSGTITTTTTSMQLAPDGKIYISEFPGWEGLKYLHVIHSPDSAGKKARFEKNSFDLKGKRSAGLPDFIQSFFIKRAFEVRQNCKRDTTFFTISNTYNLDSAHWDFGDAASGNDNFSKKKVNVFHCYKKPGLYKAQLISFHKEYKDTIFETFFVNYAKPYLGKDTVICNSDKISLAPKGDYTSYKWNTNAKTKKISTFRDGPYELTVTDYDGCVSSDTIEIQYSVKANIGISPKEQCLKNNFFTFNETTKYTNDKLKQCTWYFSDGTSISDTIAKKTFNKAGIYSVKLISESSLGCRDSLAKIVSVYPQSKVSFSINKSDQCLNGNSYYFKINRDTGKINYQWDLGDQSITFPTDIIDKRYAKEGFYKVQLIGITDKNCKDTLTESINVLYNPKIDFSWDLACPRALTKFYYTGTKPVDSFNWNFNNQSSSILENPTLSFDTTGIKKIKLMVIAVNGCIDSLTKEVIIQPKSKADFLTGEFCETDSVWFDNISFGATGYNWKFGDGNTSQRKLPKHIYSIGGQSTTFNVSLVAIVAGGCSDSITKPLTVNANPVSDFSFTKTGLTLELTANQLNNVNYLWKFGNTDSASNSSGNYSHSIKSADQNKVCLKVTNLAGCVSQTCKNIIASGLDFNKGKGFELYPNPNSGKFTIKLENPANDVSIIVYDQLGNLIKNEEPNSDKFFYEFNLKVSNGFYLVKVQSGGGYFIQKILVWK